MTREIWAVCPWCGEEQPSSLEAFKKHLAEECSRKDERLDAWLNVLEKPTKR